MFGKAKCKLCGDDVRLALKHLREKHQEVYESEAKSKTSVGKVMDKYFTS